MKNTALVVASLLFSLVLVELGLRLLDPLNVQPHVSRSIANVPLVNDEYYFCKGGPSQLVPHPVVFSRDTPNQSYFEFRNDRASFFEINSHGFRGSFGADEGRGRVLVLGDSFTRGTLADETETIPALLSEWSTDSHFVNLGTGGHGTMQHALTYREFKDKIPHEAVLLFAFTGNDLVDNIRFSEWQKDPTARTTEPTTSQWLKQMAVKLYIGKLLQGFSNSVSQESKFASAPTDKERGLLLNSLADLSQAVAENGARLFVFSLPEISEFVGSDKATFREDPVGYGNAARELIEQAAKANEFTYIDLKPSLVEASDRMKVPTTALFGQPDHHLQEVANYALAQTVADALENEGVTDFARDAQFIDRTRFDPAAVTCP